MAGIVIIGAGECGVRAAFALREQGYEGAVTLLGDEVTLPYERPPLSKGPDGTARPIRPLEAYDDARIKRRFGTRVADVDAKSRKVTTSDGADLSYDQLLLATGARARLFPGLEGCLTLRTDADAAVIFECLKPGARIGIIGGGFIGLELASTARKIGADVNVFEAAPRLLGRALPAEIAGVIQRRHETEGVHIQTGVVVTRADGRSVTLADGTKHAFDAVIAGVGATPNTELAEVTGLDVENGIVVDGDFRTSDPHIYAAGDCCSFEWQGAPVRLESWKAAQDQGSHVASAMLGNREAYSKVPWFWSDQYDLTLQVAGLFDHARPVLRRETQDETRLVFQCNDAGRLRAAAGIGLGNAVAKDIRIFEKLIERGAPVDANLLADPSESLKRLLKAA